MIIKYIYSFSVVINYVFGDKKIRTRYKNFMDQTLQDLKGKNDRLNSLTLNADPAQRLLFT